MKKVLIVGGSGSWGNALCRKLLSITDVEEIRIFSRNEFKQVEMMRKFPDSRVKFIIGDVRDYDAVNCACRNVHIVYLLSAIKHVPICEDQPDEAIKTNIIGTQNVIKACIENRIETCIDVSTDKACAPNNLYGMTKAVGEKLILNANKYNKTKFICIRAGNVLGSAGSVVPLFIDQIKQKNEMTVTNGNMTRYFMSLPEAIDLLLTATDAPRGSLLVMKMPSCTIYELADTLGYLYGDEITTVQVIGSRPGEKLHEMLVSPEEAPYTYQYNDNYYIISEQHQKDLKLVGFDYYSSNSQELMNKEQIITMLKKGGFCG